jgi:hypothetical protein
MSDLRSLIEAAKADAPTAAVRTKVWAGVSGAIGEAAAAATGAAALAGTTSAAKMLVIGTLLGGAFTVGIGAAFLFVGPAPRVGSGLGSITAGAAPIRTGGATRISAVTAISASIENQDSKPTLSAAANPHSSAATHALPTSTHPSPGRSVSARLEHAPAPAATPRAAGTEDPSDDALAREASLLANARSALSRSDALSALEMVRRLRALPGGQLKPEELAVEAQALRALGLSSDADEVDSTLRTRFPDSVLGR